MDIRIIQLEQRERRIEFCPIRIISYWPICFGTKSDGSDWCRGETAPCIEQTRLNWTAEFKERLSYLFCCEVGVSARLRVDVAFVKEVLRLTSMLQNLPGDLQDEIAKTTIAYYESQRFIANI